MNEYRSSERARHHRKQSLQNELDDLRRRLGEGETLRARAAQLEAELSQMAREESNPDAWIHRLKVAAPCRERWDAMTGEDRVRHCGRCDKEVYFLSGMRRDEAAELLQQRPEGLCVRLRKRRDGTVVFGDCGPGKAARARNRVVAAGAVAAAAVLGAGALGALALGRAGEEDTVLVMGELAPKSDLPANNPVTIPALDNRLGPSEPETPLRDTSRLGSSPR